MTVTHLKFSWGRLACMIYHHWQSLNVSSWKVRIQHLNLSISKKHTTKVFWIKQNPLCQTHVVLVSRPSTLSSQCVSRCSWILLNKCTALVQENRYLFGGTYYPMENHVTTENPLQALGVGQKISQVKNVIETRYCEYVLGIDFKKVIG